MLRQINEDVLGGFKTRDDVLETVRDIFYDEQDVDDKWLAAMINHAYDAQQVASTSWKEFTDFSAPCCRF